MFISSFKCSMYSLGFLTSISLINYAYKYSVMNKQASEIDASLLSGEIHSNTRYRALLTGQKVLKASQHTILKSKSQLDRSFVSLSHRIQIEQKSQKTIKFSSTATRKLHSFYTYNCQPADPAKFFGTFINDRYYLSCHFIVNAVNSP